MFVGRNRLRLFNRLRRPAYYVIASATIKLAYPVSQRLHPNGAFQLVRSSDCIRQPGSFFGFPPVTIYYHTLAYLSTTFYDFIITFLFFQFILLMYPPNDSAAPRAKICHANPSPLYRFVALNAPTSQLNSV